jgi:RNA polymerase sigma-70 factor (ECF subfamily)
LHESRRARDERLIELAADGGAYLLAWRVTRNRALAEDAIQEAFCQLLRRPPREQDRKGLRAYFLRAVQGQALSMARSGRRRERREEAYVRTSGRHVSQPGNRTEPREVSRAIRDAIEALPLAEREAVSLRYEQGLTERSAAHVLSVPRSTLNRRVQRGLERMRQMLAAEGYAAMAPLELARQVSHLGVPPMPETLKTALLDRIMSAPPPGPGFQSSRRRGVAKPGAAGGSVPWALVATAAAFAPLATLAFWEADAGASGPPPLEERARPAPREAVSAPPKRERRVPLGFGETVYADGFDKPALDAFWIERSPAATPGYASAWIRASQLRMAAGRRADRRPLAIRLTPRGKKRPVHPRVEIVSRPIALGEEGLSFSARMVVLPRTKGSWEWGCEILAGDSRPLGRVSVRAGAGPAIRIADRKFDTGAPGKGRTFVVTPRGEVWLCDTEDGFRVVARERLRAKLTSIRLRLFAVIPERSARGGRVTAVWNEVLVRRVRLGVERPSGDAGR